MKKYRIHIAVAVLLLVILFKVEKQVYDLNGKKLGKFVGEQADPDCPLAEQDGSGDWVVNACLPVNNYLSGNSVKYIKKTESVIKHKVVLRFKK